MTTFWAAGIVLVSPQNAAGRRGRRWAAVGRRLAAAGAHGELPQRVAVRRGPGGAVHPHVAAGAGDVERLRAAGAGRGAVDGGPGRCRWPETWIWNARAYAASQVSTTWQIAGERAEVDLDPLRVAERARPAGAGVAVDRAPGRGVGVLGGRRAWPGGPAPRWRVPQPVPPPIDAVDLELPQRVAVRRGAGGAVHPHVPAGAGDREGLRAAGAGGGAVDGGPGRCRWRRPGSGTSGRTPPPRSATTWSIGGGLRRGRPGSTVDR